MSKTKVDTIRDDVVTATRVTFPPVPDWETPELVGVGTARRSPEDAPDPIVGELLSRGRALASLAQQLIDLGHERSRGVKEFVDSGWREWEQRVRTGIASANEVRDAEQREDVRRAGIRSKVQNMTVPQLFETAKSLGVTAGMPGVGRCFDPEYHKHVKLREAVIARLIDGPAGTPDLTEQLQASVAEVEARKKEAAERRILAMGDIELHAEAVRLDLMGYRSCLSPCSAHLSAYDIGVIRNALRKEAGLA